MADKSKPSFNLFGTFEDQKIYDNPDTRVYMLKMPFMSPGPVSRTRYQVVGVFVGVKTFLKYIREKYHIEPSFNWNEFKNRFTNMTSLEIDEYQGFGESLTFEQMDKCIGPVIDDYVDAYSSGMGAFIKAFSKDII